MTVNPNQFEEALDIINRSKGFIEGDDLKKVFKVANIRSWPMSDMPASTRGVYGRDSTGLIYRHETLNTAQSHLHAPTLRKYMTEGAPEEDPHHEGHRYLPEVLWSQRGSRWIDEGHHRIVADRLNDFSATEVYEGELGK